ncbi:MAG: hypothetical protein ACK57V_24770, partial [Pirellula sp.]
DLVTGAGTYTEVYDPTVRHYDTTNWDPRNSYEHLLDGSPDPNPPPPSGGEPPIAPPTVYPPNPYTGNSFLGWIAGRNGDGFDQVCNFTYGLGDGASFGVSKMIRQNSGLFKDRADYDGNAYFGGDFVSAFAPTPGAIANCFCPDVSFFRRVLRNYHTNDSIAVSSVKVVSGGSKDSITVLQWQQQLAWR